MDNRPLSEVFAEAARDWTDKEASAQMLEDTKTLIMAQKQTALGGDMPVNRAEQQIKASPEWYDHVEKIVIARKVANEAKMRLEVIRMRFNERTSEEANKRTEMKMVG